MKMHVFILKLHILFGNIMYLCSIKTINYGIRQSSQNSENRTPSSYL